MLACHTLLHRHRTAPWIVANGNNGNGNDGNGNGNRNGNDGGTTGTTGTKITTPGTTGTTETTGATTIGTPTRSSKHFLFLKNIIFLDRLQTASTTPLPCLKYATMRLASTLASLVASGALGQAQSHQTTDKSCLALTTCEQRKGIPGCTYCQNLHCCFDMSLTDRQWLPTNNTNNNTTATNNNDTTNCQQQ